MIVRMPPDLTFNSALKSAQSPASQGKGTITVTEAKKALAELSGHPGADAADRARIVQGFLDGKEGKALSPKARKELADFVTKQGSVATGTTASELKAGALKEARAANVDLDKAREHVTALLNAGVAHPGHPPPLVAAAQLASVVSGLDAALANVADARKNLGSLLKVADFAAATADAELKGAGKEIAQARKDVAALVAGAKGGLVTKAQLTEVREWLAEPRPELLNARRALGDIPISVTAKFPSDAEDGGFNGGGMGGGFPTTRKFPSDNEDGGGAIFTTMKAPSDNEDGGGAVGGGGGVVTEKFPSDNEDAGGGGGVFHTMKAPSDSEDAGGGPFIHPPAPGVKPAVKQERIDDMKKTLEAAIKGGNANWQNSMPLGVRFETVLLKKDAHPDGYKYEALIPLGALTPTAPQADPNTVGSFWVKQTGGLAGLTQFAGPFNITTGHNLIPPHGKGVIEGTLQKKNHEFFLTSGGFTFEILAGGAAKQALANAHSGDQLKINGKFDMLTDPSGGPMRRVVETEDITKI